MQNRFNTLFEYSEGKLYNKVSRGSAKKGSEAGYLMQDGYRGVRVDGKYYIVHRIIFVMHHGDIPGNYIIDHIDRNKLNNRIENLRLATLQENQFNRTTKRNTSSEYKGVWFDSVKGFWKAAIRINGERHYIGQFNLEEEAAIAYDELALKHHGVYANLNILEITDTV
jgi:hypothetical protein